MNSTDCFPRVYTKFKNVTSLKQGDILKTSLIPFNKKAKTIYKDIIGWILLNTDCDVSEKGRINFYIVAAVYPISVFLKNKSYSKDSLLKLIDHKLKEFYFLYPHKILNVDGAFVELGFTRSLPAIIKPKNNENMYENLILNFHLRLVYEYRKHFTYRLSNYYNRSGIPPIDRSIKNKWSEERIKFFKAKNKLEKS